MYKRQRFGYAVALAELTLAVGAPDAQPGGVSSGAVHVFERSPAGWSETALLAGSNASTGDDFGQAVALDAGLLVAGAPHDSTEAFFWSGEAYLFERTPQGWVQRERFVDDVPEAKEKFGQAVGIAGGLAVVGVPEDDALAPAAGAAWIFDRRTLRGEPLTAGLTAGGVQSFELEAGAEHAGLPYLFLGTLAGTDPGLPLDPATVLPLNPDAYTLALLGSLGAPLAGGSGVLDAAGRAAASFTLPQGLSPNLLGLVLHHAYVVLDFNQGTLEHASNPVPLQLVL